MTTLLRAEARTCTSFMTMIFQFAPLRRGIFLCFRIAVMRGHGRVRVAPSHAERNLLEPLLGATAGRLSR
jgi:hypothetical protein